MDSFTQAVISIKLMEMLFNCHEKHGSVLRTVSLMEKTVPKILDTLERLKTVRNFFDRGIDPYLVMIKPENVFFEVDDVGLIFFEPDPDVSFVHLTFWDKRMRGREELCKGMIEFGQALVQKPVVIRTRAEYRTTIAFASRLGFQRLGVDSEGTLFMGYTNYPR